MRSEKVRRHVLCTMIRTRNFCVQHFQEFVQYKIGLMFFFSFVITTEWQDWRSEKREHWDLILGPRTELPFVLPMGLQRRWFIC